MVDHAAVGPLARRAPAAVPTGNPFHANRHPNLARLPIPLYSLTLPPISDR